jgi:Domain of unknown function (DUF4397)
VQHLCAHSRQVRREGVEDGRAGEMTRRWGNVLRYSGGPGGIAMLCRRMRTARLVLGAAALLAAMTGSAAPAGAQGEGTATVTLMSGLPDTAVDFYVDGERQAGDVRPGAVSDALSLPPGDHEVAVRPAGDDADRQPLFTQRVELAVGANVTIAAHLDDAGLERLSTFENDLSPLGAGQARLSVRHTAALALADVRVDGRAVVTDLVNARAAATTLPSGSAAVELTLAGQREPVLGPVDVELREGALTAVYPIGSPRDDTVEVVVQTLRLPAPAPEPGATGVLGRQVAPSPGSGTAVLTAIHGIPERPVDVYLDGQAQLVDFAPGSITDPLSVPAGSVDVEIRAAGAAPDDRPLVAKTLTLDPGGNMSLVAHLTSSGFPTVTPYTNDLSTLGAGQARLTVRHAAAVGAVDVRAGQQILLPGVRNGQEKAAVLPAGSASAELAASGSGRSVLEPSPLSLPEGTATIVYAVGSPEDDSLELLVQTIPGLYSAPVGAAAGDGGLLAPGGVPLWVIALMLGATVTGIVSAHRLRAARP